MPGGWIVPPKSPLRKYLPKNYDALSARQQNKAFEAASKMRYENSARGRAAKEREQETGIRPVTCTTHYKAITDGGNVSWRKLTRISEGEKVLSTKGPAIIKKVIDDNGILVTKLSSGGDLILK